jgi:membrane protein DedA with SNARE-associated domain
VWTSIWVGLGWFLGDRWANASTEARLVGVAIGAIATLAFVGFQLWRRLRHRPVVV